MKKSEEFKDYIVFDLLGDFSGIFARAMFSGYGIYKDGKIFAIIAEGGLYFKADEKTADFFRERGSRRFTYTKKNGKKFAMNYWFVSEEVLENREAFAEWVDVAFSVK